MVDSTLVKKQTLTDLRVLVTRPQHQAPNFIQAINELGGLAFHLPTIEIVFSTDQPSMADADLIVFTSVNSVRGANPESAKFSAPGSPLIAAIGNATANTLRECGFHNILSPAQNGNSETLLELLKPHIIPTMKAVIVRGDGGRDALRDGLHELGAQVRYEQVYQRKLPSQVTSVDTPGALWRIANPHIVTVSSDLGLDNLMIMLPADLHHQLLGRPLIVNSERCRQRALTTGFSAVISVANPPGDEGQIGQLINYALSR